MIELTGKYNTAKVFTDVVEETAVGQIINLCNQEFMEGSRIRVMPDCHAGAGCTIGFTMTVTDKVCPNLVGVDIGCGMRTIELGKRDIDYAALDRIIRKHVPHRKNAHEGRQFKFHRLHDLKCFRSLKNTAWFERSLGTLGGGNHFIEVDADEDGGKYLIIHTGSRNLGYQVADYYQRLAIDICSGKDKMFEEKQQIIREYKAEGRKNEIQRALKNLEKHYAHLKPSMPRDLCFLTGEYKDDYLHDMRICQQFAVANRDYIAKIILKHLGGRVLSEFETVHNYINFDDSILRKGAVSANQGEMLLIPINMRDGCILGVGKGNADWNNSAPHGAGRLMSRSKAKDTLDLAEFKQSMEGVFTTTVGLDTLDEAPMAYKRMEDIVDNIADAVTIKKILKPEYNFKASE